MRVTKKVDISNFYFNLSKHVAFGAWETETKRTGKRQEEVKVRGLEKSRDVTVSATQAVKRKSAKTYAKLAQETGLTNVYVAQILKGQALLSPEAAHMLRALPGLPKDSVLEMMEPPRRSYDPLLIQDPAIYRRHSVYAYVALLLL
ncbi:hypothetical protein RJ639_027663 [Escallonia herrerae]|uniref:Uncharacterized protein n=1 Tax=Escallonia herrerae TaxID=1293975 RepID=A0AA88X4Z0_9ASTE|nr:hypothetical protein RJ639_027663 [Escallonia herrerae]